MSWSAFALEFVLFVGATLGASALHELTHYLAAASLGRDRRFSVREWAVYFEPGGIRGTVLIQAAPMVVGVLAAPVAVGLWGIEELFVVPWLVYTFLGAVTNDFGFHFLDLVR